MQKTTIYMENINISGGKQEEITKKSGTIAPLLCPSGAATRIRTGDLILTKDALYQLSHSSVPV